MVAVDPELSVRGIGSQTVGMRSRSFELVRLGPAECHDVIYWFVGGRLPVRDAAGHGSAAQSAFFSYATGRLLIATHAQDGQIR